MDFAKSFRLSYLRRTISRSKGDLVSLESFYAFGLECFALFAEFHQLAVSEARGYKNPGILASSIWY